VKFSHQEDVMKTLLLSASVFSALTVIAVAAEPQMIWEASGFKSPESAAYDRAAGAIYISNLNGGAMEKDGNGFISKLGPDGKVIALEWVKGLDSPTGLALANNRLYAADVDKIVEIDVGKGEIVGRYEAPGAKFLNDLAADKEGRVYASDMVANSIWVLDKGKLSLLLQNEALDNPNGLLVEEGRIVVASWGKMAQDFSTKVPGHLMVIDLATKKVSDLGDPKPVGNPDGVEPDGKGGYFVTDWMKGGLFRIARDGTTTRLLPLKPGSADLGTGPDGIVIIPMMKDGTVLAYKVD
jgi:sugar lactone lactonase YvrE